MQRRALCRSRRELSNEYLLAKFGFDTAENEPYHFVSSSSREFEFELWNFEPFICSPGYRPSASQPRRLRPACSRSRRVRRSPRRGAQLGATFGGSNPARAPRFRAPRKCRANVPMFFLTFIPTFGYFLANFERLVLGCINAKFCKKNTRLKALDEIFKIYTLLQLWTPIWKPRKAPLSIQNFSQISSMFFAFSESYFQNFTDFSKKSCL